MKNYATNKERINYYMHILDVKENFMGTNHYYEDNTLPSKEETVKKINQVILNWQ